MGCAAADIGLKGGIYPTAMDEEIERAARTDLTHSLAQHAHPTSTGLSPSVRPFRTGDPKNEDIFKWPDINLEDLIQAKPLLLLLNSRGRNPPHVFAHTTHKSFNIGRQYERISVKLVGLRTMFFTGQENAESYGKLVHLESKEQHADFLSNHLIHFNPTGASWYSRCRADFLNS